MFTFLKSNECAIFDTEMYSVQIFQTDQFCRSISFTNRLRDPVVIDYRKGTVHPETNRCDVSHL